MSKRTGDLWWVSPPSAVGPLVIVILIVGVVLVAWCAATGRYMEAVLTVGAGISLLCMAILDVLGEILGSIRDLDGHLAGRHNRDDERPA